MARYIAIKQAFYPGFTPDTPVQVAGVVQGGFRIERNAAQGQSDGQVGPTSMDQRTVAVMGFLLLEDEDEYDRILTLDNKTLQLVYVKSGGTTGNINLDKAIFTEAPDYPIPAVNDRGKVARYRLNFEGVFNSADTQLSDFMAIT